MASVSEQEIRYWVGFSKVQGIGSARMRALLDYFGDLETAWGQQHMTFSRPASTGAPWPTCSRRDRS